MHTSLLLVALLGPGETLTASDAPSWQTSYSAALAAARERGKPVAVFVGRGADGWKKVSAEGVSADATKALADYVCVYVDASKPTNDDLVRSLEVTSGTGLILGTKDGKSQAFWHDGTMSSFELERALRRHSSGDAVTSTDMLASSRQAAAPAIQNAVPPATFGAVRYGTIAAPSYAPAYAPRYAAPAYAPSYAPSFAPSYGGGGGC